LSGDLVSISQLLNFPLTKSLWNLDNESAPTPTLLSNDSHEILKAWIAAALWLALIAFESTAMLSSENTGRILYPLLHYLFNLDWQRFDYLHFYIRKTGHVIGYATLCFLLFRAWRATLPAIDHAKWAARWAGLAILGTAIVASLDEWHQSFIPSRTGRWQDVVLDTSAGVGAQILILLWLWKSGRRTTDDQRRL
jgi:VanZ family protein